MSTTPDERHHHHEGRACEADVTYVFEIAAQFFAVELARSRGETAVAAIGTDDDKGLAVATVADPDRVLGSVNSVDAGPLDGGLDHLAQRTLGVTAEQFSSNCPRLTAVSTAVPCLASRKWVLLSHAAAQSATRSSELAYAFRMKTSFVPDDAEGGASTPRDDPALRCEQRLELVGDLVDEPARFRVDVGS